MLFLLLIKIVIAQHCGNTGHECPHNTFKNAAKPVIYHLMVFAPSQHGKSTFVNNCLDQAGANCERAKVGDGSGESVTINVTAYTMKAFIELFPDARPGYDIIKIIDVPGLFDSGLRITKEEIFSEIKKTLLESGVNTIDAFILFESVKDDSRKFLITLTTALELFGEPLRPSSILLTTKWDKLNEREKQKVEPVIEGFVTASNIQTQKWFINYEDFKFGNDQVSAQFSELGSRLKKLRKYEVAEMDELLRKRDLLAEKLREQDPDRLVTEEFEQEVQEAEEYLEDELVKVTEWVALSEVEIENKAQKMWENQVPIPGELIPEKIFKEVTKNVTEYIPRVVTNNMIIEVGTFFPDEYVIPIQHVEFDRLEKTIIEYVVDFEFHRGDDKKLDLNFFKNMLEGQMKPETVDKIVPTRKVRTRPVIKKIQVNHDRYDFEHYQMLAVKMMQKELVDSVRNK